MLFNLHITLPSFASGGCENVLGGVQAKTWVFSSLLSTVIVGLCSKLCFFEVSNVYFTLSEVHFTEKKRSRMLNYSKEASKSLRSG